jgi:hypothetical protein
MLKIAIPFRVQLGEEEIAGTIRFADALAIERRFKEPISAQITWPLDWLAFGAWNSLTRTKAYTDSYDVFTDAIEGLTTEAPEDPKATEQDQPQEQSQSSPTDSNPAPEGS